MGKGPLMNLKDYLAVKSGGLLTGFGRGQPGEGAGVNEAGSSAQASTWRHPGGKLRELGPATLTDAELLAILISSGIKGKSAEEIAKEILKRFGSFKGMANQPRERQAERLKRKLPVCPKRAN